MRGEHLAYASFIDLVSRTVPFDCFTVLVEKVATRVIPEVLAVYVLVCWFLVTAYGVSSSVGVGSLFSFLALASAEWSMVFEC